MHPQYLILRATLIHSDPELGDTYQYEIAATSEGDEAHALAVLAHHQQSAPGEYLLAKTKQKARRKRSVKTLPPGDSKLEKIRQSSQVWLAKYISVGTLNELSKAILPCICRVESPLIGRVLGSGFLIAPGLVLTNFHVLNEVPGSDELAIKCSKLEFRFEFTEFNDIKNPGNVFKAQKEASLLAFSSAANLDYALIHLDEIPYDLNGTAISLFSKISNRNVVLDEPIWVVQHPLGDPMQAGWGKIIYVSSEGYWFQYDANTDRGSSGSPVLDINLNLIGLHHSAGPNRNTKELEFGNEGISLASILPEIQEYLDKASATSRKPKNPYGLPDLAIRIAKRFYENDKEGMVIGHDSISNIVQALGEDLTEVKDTLENLEKKGLVEINWRGLDEGSVRSKFGLLAAIYDMLDYNLSHDALIIARILVEAKTMVTNEELKEKTKLEIPRLNRAILFMKHQDLINLAQGFGGLPYAFSDAQANWKTRDFVRKNQDVP